METIKNDLSKIFPFVDTSKLQHYKHDYKIEKQTLWSQEVGNAVYRLWEKDFDFFGYNLSSEGGVK